MNNDLEDIRECDVGLSVPLVDRFKDNVRTVHAGTVFNLYNKESKDHSVNVIGKGKGTNVLLCEDVQVVDTRMSDESVVLGVLEELSKLQLENEEANKILEHLPIESEVYKNGSLRSLFDEYVPVMYLGSFCTMINQSQRSISHSIGYSYL